MSQGNILKEFFNYNFDDSFEVDDEKDILTVKFEYELTMAMIK